MRGRGTDMRGQIPGGPCTTFFTCAQRSKLLAALLLRIGPPVSVRSDRNSVPARRFHSYRYATGQDCEGECIDDHVQHAEALVTMNNRMHNATQEWRDKSCLGLCNEC